ncbi:radical SAM family heme chaperone HemW [Qipengyuania spongiae]|uniref:Heme chaperone HemW n=1 Tax=Qipengyuania spongiae TaxID=2909673 RepID=A0ABY5SWB3_9SPHN|nr:radical SAM family heme chaperone HemW [Qipengyuania spongiae]UVI38852.1 radical SAM family heme chaperone HemW [Qipengyuania spongiae]
MPQALYLHWPFCLAKCPYCDFNSHVREKTDIAAWQKALVRDLRYEADRAEITPLRSIFFGGGTPSLMPPALVGALLDEAGTLFGFADGIEITLEANPSSVEAANFADLAKAGVNRVSLGVQSLEDEALRFLGRLHNADEALKAIGIAQKEFARVSIDLIYARPGQNQTAWHGELERALAIGTDHLSLYQLTIEPNTRFATDVRRRVFDPLADDPAADLFALTREMTRAAGRPAYEVSNHAVPGQESRHNLTYWRYEDYLGVGPGAHGRRDGLATNRVRKPENYLARIAEAGHGMAEERALSPEEQAMEALLMGLRLAEGVDLARLETRFGMDATALVDDDRITRYLDAGLIWREGQRLGVSENGMPVLDALLGEIVADGLVAA